MFFFSIKNATTMSSMSWLAILFDYFLHYHGAPHCGINKTLIRIKHIREYHQHFESTHRPERKDLGTSIKADRVIMSGDRCR